MNWKNILRKRARIRARQHFSRHLGCYDMRHMGRSAEVHHMDGDVQNGAIENLIPLCRECHIQVHVDMRRRNRENSLRVNLPNADEADPLNTPKSSGGSVSR